VCAKLLLLVGDDDDKSKSPAAAGQLLQTSAAIIILSAESWSSSSGREVERRSRDSHEADDESLQVVLVPSSVLLLPLVRLFSGDEVHLDRDDEVSLLLLFEFIVGELLLLLSEGDGTDIPTLVPR